MAGENYVAKESTLLDVQTKLNALIVDNRIIKSIQRGTAVVDENGVAVTISAVDASKSIVLLDGGSTVSTANGGAYLGGLSATGFNLYASNADVIVKVSWQVVEFY